MSKYEELEERIAKLEKFKKEMEIFFDMLLQAMNIREDEK